jgi:hypothetical protein
VYQKTKVKKNEKQHRVLSKCGNFHFSLGPQNYELLSRRLASSFIPSHAFYWFHSILHYIIFTIDYSRYSRYTRCSFYNKLSQFQPLQYTNGTIYQYRSIYTLLVQCRAERKQLSRRALLLRFTGPLRLRSRGLYNSHHQFPGHPLLTEVVKARTTVCTRVTAMSCLKAVSFRDTVSVLYATGNVPSFNGDIEVHSAVLFQTGW